jgi:hypothetical protein
MTGPTTRPFLRAFTFSGAGIALVLAALLTTQGLPGSSEGAGEVVGRLLVLFGLPGLLTGWLASRSRSAWPTWKIGLVMLTATIVLLFITLFRDLTALAR